MQGVSGGAEAASVSCIALRNRMRPDLKKEDLLRRTSHIPGVKPDTSGVTKLKDVAGRGDKE